MNKHDIVRKIATKHDKSVIEIRRIIDDFLDEIMLTVVQKGRFVQLVGFGKFYTLVRKRVEVEIHVRVKRCTSRNQLE